jgi:hypothetical protein
MSRFTPILALTIAMMASSCVSNSRGPRSAGNSRPFNIWSQSPVAYNTGLYPGALGDIDPDSLSGLYAYPQISNRPYTGVSGIPDTTRLYNPVPPSSYPVGSGAHSGFETRRLSGSVGSRSLAPRSEVFPAHRHPLSQINDPWRRRLSTTRGNSAADHLASASSGARPKPEADEPPAARSESHPAPADPSKLPFAQPVPGRSGYVKLSGHPDLPEIDVRGIAPGTPVEIPNPGQSGQTIQFRVP